MNREEWSQQLNEKINKIHQERPEWSMSKCKFLALKDMPEFPGDGWK